MSLRDVLTPDQRVDELVRVALTTDERLDDITRAKIWTRLEDRIEDPAPARWPWLLGGAAAAALVAALIFATQHAPRSNAEAWVARRGSTVSLNVGPHTRAALVGPAQLDIIEIAEATTVALRSGTLLAEFEGGPGRSLTIEAPGARIEIVGTLFSVDVSGKTTCVSVAHGRVRMTTFERVIEIGGGQGACSDEFELHPMPAGVREALARHEAVLAAETKIPTPSPSPSPSPSPNPNPSPIPTPTPPPTRIPTAPPSSTPPRIVAAPINTPTVAPTPRSASVEPDPKPEPDAAQAASTASPDQPPQPKPASDAGSAAPQPRADSVLYREAEAAIAKRDFDAADRALGKIVELPASALLDQALYERARIAYQRHAWSDARDHLARLATLTSPLLEPGAYLGCKVALAAGDASADRCLADYRARFPHAPHDLDALGQLTERAYRAGGCARAAIFVDELARLYQATTLARGWKERCP